MSTRVDIAETEMRAFRTQESWIGPEIQEIQKLNEELMEQKSQLLSQIAKQADEIVELSAQIQDLRSELERWQQDRGKPDQSFDHQRQHPARRS